MNNFKIRGFIEGFYGRVWSDEKRRRVLKLVAEGGMNAYFYAPKDDPFLRQKWRSKYDAESLEKFSSLFRFTDEIGISLYYCLSPGLDIIYSSEKDMRALVEKFNSIYALGVRHFGLFLDDILPKLTHEADKNIFGSVCEAHVFLIKFLVKLMPEDTELVVCPMQYHGDGSEEYITGLCRGIPEEVKVFWTGRKICSPELSSEDAQKFISHTGRKPLYWDNFPVNDAEMYGEMHIGPYMNRSADLADYSEGIVSNVMEYPLCSAIPLLTICDYLNDPQNYDPESSFAGAAEKVIGEEYGLWMPFFDHTRYSCLCDSFSVSLAEKLGEIYSDLLKGNKKTAIPALCELIVDYERCIHAMQRNTEMYSELKKWADKFEETKDILRYAECFILTGKEAHRTGLKQLMIKYNENAYRLAGFDLRAFVENIIGEFTV